MRVCPKCGFVDPPCWRQNRWISYVDYARVEDFWEQYPAMVDIQPGHETSDEYNYYYRGRRNPYYVYRWPKVLGPRYYTRSRHLTERHVPRNPPDQSQTTMKGW